MKVQIGFDLAPNGVGDWFTLDDAVKGELDNTTYVLSGEVLVDVTDRARSVSVSRGRSRTLEKVTAGVASVVLDNRDRYLDPLNSSSPYYGSIVPRKQVKISVDDQYLFVGNIEDYSFDYQLSGDATTTAQAIDGFSLIANIALAAGTATAQAPGARISAILTELGWPDTARALSTGSVTLDADEIKDDTDALAYLQKVEISEPGAFFISRSGVATFRDRADLQNVSNVITFGTAGIPFVEYQAASVTDELLNSVSVTYYGGTAVAGTAVASDATSQAAYGMFKRNVDTLLASVGDAQTLADYLIAQGKDPKYRVDSITVLLDDLTTAQRADVLALDVGSVALVSFTPNGVGAAISQYVTVDKVAHQATPAQHAVTFTLSQTEAALILDDAVFGRLDFNTLGF